MGDRVSGVQGRHATWAFIDTGTMCLAPSPKPGSTGRDGAANDSQALEYALAALQVQAETFAWRFINDARARQAYVARIAAAVQQLRKDVAAGVMSAADAAAVANDGRNVIMKEIRATTSAIGRAGAEAIKASDLTLELVWCADLFCTYPATAARAALARVTLARMSLAEAVQMRISEQRDRCFRHRDRRFRERDRSFR